MFLQGSRDFPLSMGLVRKDAGLFHGVPRYEPQRCEVVSTELRAAELNLFFR